MVATLSLTLALGACVQPAPQGAGQGQGASGPVRVTKPGGVFEQYEGAAARREAEAVCASRGQRLRPSIYVRFEAGSWVYVGGCA